MRTIKKIYKAPKVNMGGIILDQPLTYEQTPTVISPDKKVIVKVVAGKFKGASGTINTYSPLLTLRLDIKKGGKIEIPIPKNYNSFLYQLDGSLKINGTAETAHKDLIWFNNNGSSITIGGIENTRAILLAGEPIGEKVTSHGPFVMNTQTEILEAIRDYQQGKMGILIEEFD
jgi:redox-sensitive bicupin YhaK (pirin superfamily)